MFIIAISDFLWDHPKGRYAITLNSLNTDLTYFSKNFIHEKIIRFLNWDSELHRHLSSRYSRKPPSQLAAMGTKNLA